ncbi:efflux RND transporter periplasmic adaptor subunit [Alteromonas gracilis]|uniref:efflux RND transporter periplasmic adaptor subunit n=1 Tax=Alteromonas gracilis TaxID=1479524 RepID=UPI0030D009B1
MKVFTRSLVLSMSTLVSMSFSSAVWAQDSSVPPVLVQVDEAREQAISQLTWVPGTILSQTDANLASEVDGRITWMAEVGDIVNAGEPLVVLDDTRLNITLNQNKSNIAQWQSQVRLFEKRLVRFKNLKANNNMSQGELDAVEADLENAKQELAQAKLDLAFTQYQVEQSQVRAPFTALVVERLQSPGEYTGVGQTLLRVVNPDNVEVQVRAPLTVLPYVENGMMVNVQSKTHQVEEAIRAIVPVGNANSRMMELRIAIKPGDFPIGSAVRVAIPSSEAHDGVTIPRDALVLRKSGTFIYQLNENNEAQQVKVRTGVGLGERIEVFGEVDPKQHVVVRGAERLREGQKVRFEEADATLTAKN